MSETIDIPAEVESLNRLNLKFAGVVADKVARFPVEVLPPPLQNYVTTASESVGCPLDFIGVSMLVEAGAAIGMQRMIEIKPGWREMAILFLAIISDPGDKKSPAIKNVSKPLRDLQKELAKKYKAQMKQYREDLATYKIQIKAWSELLKAATKKGEGFSGKKPSEPIKPILIRVFTTDSTTEAMAQILSENPNGILLLCDELTAWVQSMDKYRSGRGADQQFYLSAWHAAQIIVDRKGTPEPLIVQFSFICVLGALPPDVIDDLVDKKGREDGFLHRILFSNPDSIPPSMDSFDKNFTDEMAQIWSDVYLRLRDLPPAVESPEPGILRLSAAANKTWFDFLNSHKNELRNPDFPVHLKGPWAKLEGYCARLALILHEIRFVTGFAEGEDIDAISVLGAWKLTNYFKSHAKRVYRRLHLTVDDKRATHLIEWIKKHGGRCKAGDLIAYGVNGINKASDGLAALFDLEDRGFGYWAEKTSKKRTSGDYFILFNAEPSNPVG